MLIELPPVFASSLSLVIPLNNERIGFDRRVPNYESYLRRLLALPNVSWVELW
jgi:hypothetical protein